jgi:hypothetical protein
VMYLVFIVYRMPLFVYLNQHDESHLGCLPWKSGEMNKAEISEAVILVS